MIDTHETCSWHQDIEPTLTSSDVPDLDIVCKCVLCVKGNNRDIYVSKINTHDSGDSLTDNQDTTARQTRNRTVPITAWTAHVCQIVDIYVKQLSLPESRRCSTTDVSWVILRVGGFSLFPRSHDSPRYSNYNDNNDNTKKHTISMTQKKWRRYNMHAWFWLWWKNISWHLSDTYYWYQL